MIEYAVILAVLLSGIAAVLMTVLSESTSDVISALSTRFQLVGNQAARQGAQPAGIDLSGVLGVRPPREAEDVSPVLQALLDSVTGDEKSFFDRDREVDVAATGPVGWGAAMRVSDTPNVEDVDFSNEGDIARSLADGLSDINQTHALEMFGIIDHTTESPEEAWRRTRRILATAASVRSASGADPSNQGTVFLMTAGDYPVGSSDEPVRYFFALPSEVGSNNDSGADDEKLMVRLATGLDVQATRFGGDRYLGVSFYGINEEDLPQEVLDVAWTWEDLRDASAQGRVGFAYVSSLDEESGERPGAIRVDLDRGRDDLWSGFPNRRSQVAKPLYDLADSDQRPSDALAQVTPASRGGWSFWETGEPAGFLTGWWQPPDESTARAVEDAESFLSDFNHGARGLRSRTTESKWNKTLDGDAEDLWASLQEESQGSEFFRRLGEAMNLGEPSTMGDFVQRLTDLERAIYQDISALRRQHYSVGNVPTSDSMGVYIRAESIIDGIPRPGRP